MEYSIKNLGEDIEAFTIVFSFFNEDGEPALKEDYVSLEIKDSIKKNEIKDMVLDLEPYIIEEDYLTLDFFYISKILYKDGSHWEDPYGYYQ